ncbi:MAG TPA: 2OG-Fe(II) oxygenase [Candidatus Binatia bacterium]|nr:2OG-Fe(II) oxygenase [Candidatus Binatia bacterium]
MSRTNILGSAGPDGVNAEPFAHLVHGPVLPAELYAELASAFPDQAMILGDRRGKENASARLPAFMVAEDRRIPQLWQEFFAFHTSAEFWREIVRVFGPALRRTFPGMEQQAGRPMEQWKAGARRDRKEKDDLDLRLDCQFVINTPARQLTASVKTQHVDKLTTILSMLYYFRDPEDRSEGGDLEMYSWKHTPRFLPHRMVLPRDLALTRVVRYAPNTLVAFVNSEQSVHGVSPRGASSLPRRYVNFIVEIPFKAFATPKLGIAERVMHWPETRRLSMRDIGGDRY